MSIYDGPTLRVKELNIDELKFTEDKVFIRINDNEIVSVFLDRVFEVYNEQNKEIGSYAEVSILVPVVLDSRFIYSLKTALGYEHKVEMRKIQLKGKLYTEDHYSEYDPKGYIPLKSIYNTPNEASDGGIVPTDISKHFKVRYFNNEK